MTLVLINCPLCKYIGEVMGFVNREGAPVEGLSVPCPECGYNTTSKTDLERFRKFASDVRIFDPLDFSESISANVIINNRIKWARLEVEAQSPFSGTKEFEISIIENAPRDKLQLERKIKEIVSLMASTSDPIDRDRMNFERKILRWIKAVIERQQRI